MAKAGIVLSVYVSPPADAALDDAVELLRDPTYRMTKTPRPGLREPGFETMSGDDIINALQMRRREPRCRTRHGRCAESARVAVGTFSGAPRG